MSEVPAAADWVEFKSEQQSESNSIDVDADEDKDEFVVDIQRWFINAFIIFHICGIIIWNLPTTALQQSLANFYRPYIGVTATWQNWSMFSPDPVIYNTYLTATIHYKNGVVRDYSFPQIRKLGAISKYRQERWRKFIENTQANSDAAYWPYLARYAAIVNNRSPRQNPVTSVDLYRHQQTIVYGGFAHPRYLTMKMMSEPIIAMPSNGILKSGS